LSVVSAVPLARTTVRESVKRSVFECVGDTPVVALERLFPALGPEVLAKLELMNPGGSMKDRSARHIVESGLADGTIPPGSTLVESSSGNFGIALAMAARLNGLRFVCVVDPKTTSANVALLRQLVEPEEPAPKPRRARKREPVPA
jgi:N-(2-amino-2-carboxyethyl)-L-glutamate synthase